MFERPLDERRGLLWVTAKGFIQLDGFPTDRKATQFSFVVASDSFVTAVPPAVSRFDAQSDLGPGEVHPDSLAVRQPKLVLASRLGQTDRAKGFEQVEFESALRRSLRLEGLIEPSLHTKGAVFAHPAVTTEICGSGLRGHQLQVPAVFRCSLESPIVESGGQVVQHAMRLSHHEAAIHSAPVPAGVEPVAPAQLYPVGKVGAVSDRNDGLDGGVLHFSQPM